MGTRRTVAKGGTINWHRIAWAANYHVETAAQLLKVSTKQLYRVFVAEMGEPPKRWFKQEQLGFGRLVLQRTGSVKNAAYECGYTQVANFCRDFKKMYGQSAGAFLELENATPNQVERRPIAWKTGEARSISITRANER